MIPLSILIMSEVRITRKACLSRTMASLLVLSIIFSAFPPVLAWSPWAPAQAEIPLVPPRIPEANSGPLSRQHEFVSNSIYLFGHRKAYPNLYDSSRCDTSSIMGHTRTPIFINVSMRNPRPRCMYLPAMTSKEWSSPLALLLPPTLSASSVSRTDGYPPLKITS
jgi:hypothetical protein